MRRTLICLPFLLPLLSCEKGVSDPNPLINPPPASEYVVLEDFEDDAPALSTLAREWIGKKALPLDTLGDRWNGWYSDSSAVMNPAGAQVPNVVDASHASAPFASAIGNWEGAGKQLHVKARLRGSAYPEVGFATGIAGGWPTRFVDLTHMTALQFRAKGRGQWFATLFTDSIHSDPVEHWGEMSISINLESEWKTYVFPVAEIKPRPFSKQERSRLTWEDVRKKAFGFGFTNGQSYGEKPDDSLEMWLDDVRLIGMKDEDLGL